MGSGHMGGRTGQISRFQDAVRQQDLPTMEVSAVIDPWLLEARCENGWTPLIVASYGGATESIRKLIQLGAEVDAPNRKGTTPLMFAKGHYLRTGDAGPMCELLRAGANAAAKDQFGLRLMDYVPAERREEIAEILLRGEQP